MKEFRVIAFTHRKTPLDQVGKYHLNDEERFKRLNDLKVQLDLEELVYLSTCNRVEFIFLSSAELNNKFLQSFFSSYFNSNDEIMIEKAISQAQSYSGVAAVNHIFQVAASLDSLVVGEREILTQVRSAFEYALSNGLAADAMRVTLRKLVESSKEVYTQTPISKNPVSVVSLAYRQLRDLKIDKDSRFLIIGAGQTNTNLSKYLQKHGFSNFTVFNRSMERASQLAEMLHGKALPLQELKNYTAGFDVLVTCTAASDYLINPDLYSSLLQGDTGNKVIIDLAIPYDIHPEIYRIYNTTPILVETLKKAAEENLALRKDALIDCEVIIQKHMLEFEEMIRTRRIERAMKEVPRKIREINSIAINEVFAKELETLDANSRETLDKMLLYLEKKYISVPMKMAKEILLEKH
ncbi:MAG: glutamyl-tRNA reductase [Bacteroidia bacterium]